MEAWGLNIDATGEGSRVKITRTGLFPRYKVACAILGGPVKRRAWMSQVIVSSGLNFKKRRRLGKGVFRGRICPKRRQNVVPLIG